jgi:hypothetical protein
MRSITDTLKQLAGPVQTVPARPHMTIREARPDDAEALAVLAQLDSSRPLAGPVLVAENGGELWAAVSIDDGHVIANPFRPSGELAFALVDRARRERRRVGTFRGHDRLAGVLRPSSHRA